MRPHGGHQFVHELSLPLGSEALSVKLLELIGDQQQPFVGIFLQQQVNHIRQAQAALAEFINQLLALSQPLQLIQIGIEQ